MAVDGVFQQLAQPVQATQKTTAQSFHDVEQMAGRLQEAAAPAEEPPTRDRPLLASGPFYAVLCRKGSGGGIVGGFTGVMVEDATRTCAGGTQTTGRVPRASSLARRSAATRSVCRPGPSRLSNRGGATAR
jgi:hypothetical protein